MLEHTILGNMPQCDTIQDTISQYDKILSNMSEYDLNGNMSKYQAICQSMRQ